MQPNQIRYKSPAEVFFTREISSEAVMRLYDRINDNIKGRVAVKVHFGEPGNPNFAPARLSEALTVAVSGTWVDSNVLYLGPRRYTESHRQVALDHGFTAAPVCILDGEEEIEIEVPSMKHFDKVRVGTHFMDFDSYIVFSHATGHCAAGFGAAIKNVCMGLAAIGGKMAQHASSNPIYDADRCVSCGTCVEHCPAEAITLDPLYIDPARCIGCAKCIGYCPSKVLDVPWNSTSGPVFLERMVEYAKGIVDQRPMVYITVLANISPDCDCFGNDARPPFVGDIGIVASTDICAIDHATYDLITKKAGSKHAFVEQNNIDGAPQFTYGDEIGLGNMDYRLVDIDEI